MGSLKKDRVFYLFSTGPQLEFTDWSEVWFRGSCDFPTEDDEKYMISTLNLYYTTYPHTSYKTEHTELQSLYRVLLFHLSYHILAQGILGIVH